MDVHVGEFGGLPETRTQRLLFLRQKGIPIPFNNPLVCIVGLEPTTSQFQTE